MGVLCAVCLASSALGQALPPGPSMRGDGPPLCVLALASDGLTVTAQPGCDPDLAKLNFTQWRLDRGEVLLVPAQGEPWRFEEIDGSWRRLSNSAEKITLVRQ